jgi:hypothetical protein
MPEEPFRWSERFGGVPGLTPGQYFHLGRVDAALTASARAIEMSGDGGGLGVDLTGLDATSDEIATLADALGEIELEQAMLGSWSGGSSDIDALEAEMAALRMEDRMDDLSNLAYNGADTDLTTLDFAALEQRQEQQMVRTRMARMIGLDAYQRRGDVMALMESLVDAGTQGHPVELANAGAYDSGAAAIELATGSSDGLPCGVVDSYGRCAEPQHDIGCSHTIEAAASYGLRPQDADAWRSALQRHARSPLADADGRGWQTSDGLAATASDFYEQQTGTARRASRFEPGPDNARSPARIERQPDFPASTRDLARSFITQAMPSARPKDAQRERLAAALDPRRQAVITRMSRHPDFRWPALQAERAQAQSQRRPVMLSSPMTASDGEDVYSAICGSLGTGIGG